MTGAANNSSMLNLFRVEVEAHSATLADGLLRLEQNPTGREPLESLMRAAHSIKGAARLVGVDVVARIAHALEDCFVAIQNGGYNLGAEHIDVLLKSVDALNQVAELPAGKHAELVAENMADTDALLKALNDISSGTPDPAAPSIGHADLRQTMHPTEEPDAGSRAPRQAPTVESRVQEPVLPGTTDQTDRVLRIGSDRLNRLMGLAGESMVESRWLRGHADNIIQVKRRQTELVTLLDELRSTLEDAPISEQAVDILNLAQHKAAACRQSLTERIAELEDYDRRVTNLADRLNREVIASRMRPFADSTQGLQRAARDISRSLGKRVVVEIVGENTQVDRDILDRIEAPLNHIVRNAIDHGIEAPEERQELGKAPTGRVLIEAVHNSGMLSISISDDGRGIDTHVLRQKIVARGMVRSDMAQRLSETELMEFLFLPGFSTRDEVTEISGRGVGMDVVHTVVQEMRGLVRASAKPGRGMRIHMQLPLTLSVVRSLLVEIGGEHYAFALARIDHILNLPPDHIRVLENRQYFTHHDEHVGLVDARQVLGVDPTAPNDNHIPVIIIGDRLNRYGLVVDRFLGERDLAVQPLDPRLGKVKDIAATALMDNGDAVLIVDVDDMVRSVENLISGDRLRKVNDPVCSDTRTQKRILVVDDSITVREVERKLLESHGYAVDVAVDGMDGWNTFRFGTYDLVISDVDMPRMNGIELVSQIKGESRYAAVPVMIVSYKDRQEDRQRGLAAGADYYLTKGSFHDDSLLDAVIDLIGEARE